MALACLACHAMDNSTDSFRMDRSFRTQNMSVRSVHSDDGQEGCGGVSACFTKTNNNNSKAGPSDGRSRHARGPALRGKPMRDSAPAAKVSQRGGGSMAAFGRQQADVSVDRMVFPEPRLTRCHAVRRDLFSDWTVGECENGVGGRQLCFNMSSTTA